jgi:hypothetical protein
MKYSFLILFLVTNVFTLMGQSDFGIQKNYRKAGFLIGYNGIHNTYLDFGVYYSLKRNNSLNKYFRLSNEIRFGKVVILGPNVGVSIDYKGLNCGVSLIFYSNLSNNQLVVRPEIGLGGMHPIMINYGYSFFVNGSKELDVNAHWLIIRKYIRFLKK